MATQTLKMTIQMRRDTTENWRINKDVIPAAGEPCYDLDAHTLKIGDGVHTYEFLPTMYCGEITPAAAHYEGVREGTETDMEVIARVLDGAETATAKDDIFIVKTLIANDKYSHTAYVYDGAKWVAMDGNYNAENVYFDEDFTFTTKIGTVQTLTNGSATKAAAGKNIKEFLASLFAAEANPTKTDPSVGITLKTVKDGNGNYIYAFEVGTKLTPSYTATFEDGKYSYGPEPTGAAVESWEVTSNYGEAWDAASGTCEELTVADDTNYTITAKATHTAGSTPKTNIGNDCTDTSKKIAAGTKSKASSAITGYRSYFYGVLDTSTADEPLTSAIIREQLTNGGNYNEAKTFTLNGSATAKRIVIAIPSNSTRGGLSEVILTSAMNTPVTDSYTKTEKAVKVEGKDGFAAADYDVYVYEPSKIDAGEVHDIKLA